MPLLSPRCLPTLSLLRLAFPPACLAAGHAGAGLTPNIHFFRPRIFDTVRLQHGYVVVEANATHMSHRVLASYDGSLLDEFTLTKPAGWRSQPRDVPRATAGGGGSPGEGARRGGAFAAA